MSLAVLARGPLALLPPLGGALLMLGVLGPNLRGAAAATLAAAGGLALTLRSRVSPPAASPAVRVLERVQLGPRQTLVLGGGGGPPLPRRPRGHRHLAPAGGAGMNTAAVLLAAPFALPDPGTEPGLVCCFSSRG